jgi:hypothetical protein
VINSLPVVMISPCIIRAVSFQLLAVSHEQSVKNYETKVSPPFFKGGQGGLNRHLVIPLNPPLKKEGLKRLDSVGSIGKISMPRHAMVRRAHPIKVTTIITIISFELF